MLYRHDHGDRPKCDELGCYNDAQFIRVLKNGTKQFRKNAEGKHLCWYHTKLKYSMKNGKYIKYRKNYCENAKGPHKGWLIWNCNVIDVDPRYLTVDHLDGDHNNNEEENCMTLCPFCHHIKTDIFDSGWREKSDYEHRRDHHSTGLGALMDASEEEIAEINNLLNSAQ